MIHKEMRWVTVLNSRHLFLHGLVATLFRLLRRLADMGMQQNDSIRVCLHFVKANFVFPATPCKLNCHQRSFLRGSYTSACPHERLGPIGCLCRVLDEHKYSVASRTILQKMKQGNSDLQRFSLTQSPGRLWAHCLPQHLERSLSMAFHCSCSPVFH